MCEAHRALYVRYIRTHHYYNLIYSSTPACLKCAPNNNFLGAFKLYFDHISVPAGGEWDTMLFYNWGKLELTLHTTVVIYIIRK